MPAYAQLGYVGYVGFSGGGLAGTNVVRATSCDLRATQSIEKPDVVDGHIDKTVYQLGPIEIGGSVAFPAIHEDGAYLMKQLWRGAVTRDPSFGNLSSKYNIDVKYAQGVAFGYGDCYIDSFEWNIAQQDVVSCTANIVGTTRGSASDIYTPIGTPGDGFGQRNSRIVTWNDAVVQFGTSPSGNPADTTGSWVESNEVRSFSCNVANNMQRYYALNGTLFPTAVAATKRDIGGSMTLMGLNTNISGHGTSVNKPIAFNNQDRCTENTEVVFGYSVALSGCTSNLIIRIPGVVFEIEEVGITNDIFETTINWHALPGVPSNGEGPTTDFLDA